MKEKKTFYITTPIYYPSGSPHIGHAYTTVAADTMTRYKKMRGYDARFLTGTDEHGQKIQRKAASEGKTPIEYIDPIVDVFKNLWKTLMIDYSDFIRTTEPRHIKGVQQIFQTIYEKGDIYKSEYEGWYCTPCETFFTERQLEEGGLCPDCHRPVEKMKEESYFFRMSKYADQWLKFVEENPDFIQPESRRNEMINFVKQGLEDLCVSRTSFDWGIPITIAPKHVIYVWFDALSNYITALGYGSDNDELMQKYWPADIHLVGKDIIRFHTIIWPIMLMAAGLPLPKKVIGHGWILVGDGKMSKSMGNVIDPVVLVDKYGVDSIRYFLLRELPYGLDANYSEEALVNRINIDLANDYGNLLSRTTAMLQKFQGGIVKAPVTTDDIDDALLALMEETPAAVEACFDDMKFSDGLAALWKLVAAANKYIDEAAPWALNKAGNFDRLSTVMYNLCEVIRQVTILLAPVMPTIPAKVWQQLGISEMAEYHTWESLKEYTFPVDVQIARGEPLFPRIDLASLIIEEKPVVEEVKEPEYEPIKEEISIDDFAKVDLRTATVLACEKVPKSSKLLKFRLKVGAEERTVVSGVAKHYEPEQLVGKNMVLIANLKPVTIFGIESQGMLLYAELDGKLEAIEAPTVKGGATVK
ncbi:MAG: methionine--tRNA ligase [Firmicutes bacterium]|nr:methionine--tRNA ligase [Bacillota bacterium]